MNDDGNTSNKRETKYLENKESRREQQMQTL